MKSRAEKREIGSVAVLLLFTVFAGCILLVLLSGASFYKELVARDAGAYTARTGVQYLAAKLRHSDEAGGVQAGAFSDRTNTAADEIPTLYLRMSAGEEFYYTKIYYYDGYIRELLCSEDVILFPEDGQKILPAQSFSVTSQGSLLKITIGDCEGEVRELSLSVRSDRGEQNQ